MFKFIKGLMDGIKKFFGGNFKKKVNPVRDNGKPVGDKISNGAKPPEQE